MSEGGVAYIYYHKYKPIHIYLVIKSKRKFGVMKFNGMIAMPTERKIGDMTEYTYMYSVNYYCDVVYANVRIDDSASIVSLKVTSGSCYEKQLAADLEWLRDFYVSFMKVCGDSGVPNDMIVSMAHIIWQMLQELKDEPNKSLYEQYKSIVFIRSLCDIGVYNFDASALPATRQTIYKKYRDMIAC